MLAVMNVMLVVWLSLYLFYMAKLLRWLQSPKLRMAPEGFGVWDEVFKTLLMQAKSRKKRKQKLNLALQRFNRAEQEVLTLVLDRAVAAVRVFIREGLDAAMNQYNGGLQEK